MRWLIFVVLVTVMGHMEPTDAPSPNDLDPDLLHTIRNGHRVQCDRR